MGKRDDLDAIRRELPEEFNRSAPDTQRDGTLRYTEGSAPRPLLHRAKWAQINLGLCSSLDERRGSGQQQAPADCLLNKCERLLGVTCFGLRLCEYRYLIELAGPAFTRALEKMLASFSPAAKTAPDHRDHAAN
jgi:hypothetical protein